MKTSAFLIRYVAPALLAVGLLFAPPDSPWAVMWPDLVELVVQAETVPKTASRAPVGRRPESLAPQHERLRGEMDARDGDTVAALKSVEVQLLKSGSPSGETATVSAGSHVQVIEVRGDDLVIAVKRCRGDGHDAAIVKAADLVDWARVCEHCKRTGCLTLA